MAIGVSVDIVENRCSQKNVTTKDKEGEREIRILTGEEYFLFVFKSILLY